MKRRSFLAGMLAAPVAAQLPAMSIPDVAAVPIAPAVAGIGNRLLTSEMIAKEALRILQNAYYVGPSGWPFPAGEEHDG